MKLEDLKGLIKKGVEEGELVYVCRIRTYYELDRQIFDATKKTAYNYEYLIMCPIIDTTGKRWSGKMDVYGKNPMRNKFD